MNTRPWYRSIAATEKLLHEYAEHQRIELSYTDHAKERMYERDIDGEDVVPYARACQRCAGADRAAGLLQMQNLC